MSVGGVDGCERGGCGPSGHFVRRNAGGERFEFRAQHSLQRAQVVLAVRGRAGLLAQVPQNILALIFRHLHQQIDLSFEVAAGGEIWLIYR